MRIKDTIYPFIALLIFGCSESSIVGSELFREDGFQLSFTDTVSLSLSTVRPDSLVTSNVDRLLVGNMISSLTGTTDVESYFSLTYSLTDVGTLGESDTFDSMFLMLPLDGYMAFDGEYTEKEFVLEQVSSELELGDNGYLYNFSEIGGVRTELGRTITKVIKDREQVVEIKLDNEFGEELFEVIKESAEDLDREEFQKFIRGFGVRTEGEPGVIGLDSDTIQLIVYYTDHREVLPVANTLSFLIDEAPKYIWFNEVEVPAPLNSLKEGVKEVSSLSTDHSGVLAGGLGYEVKVGFPTIKDLLLEGLTHLVIGAELHLVPDFPDWMGKDDIPKSLVASIYDVETDLPVSTDTEFSAVLVYDDQYERDTYYQMDVSDLLDAALIEYSSADYYIRFSLGNDEHGSSFTTVYIGDQAVGSELIIYTITSKD